MSKFYDQFNELCKLRGMPHYVKRDLSFKVRATLLTPNGKMYLSLDGDNLTNVKRVVMRNVSLEEFEGNILICVEIINNRSGMFLTKYNLEKGGKIK